MTHEQLLRIYWAANPEMQFSTMVPGIGKWVDPKFEAVYVSNIAPFSQIATLSKDLKSTLCFYSTEFLKPHLKPLSSITDEDAIAVAKMAIPGSGHFNIIKSDGGILIRCHKDGHFLKFWIEYHNGFVLKIYGDRDYEPPVNNPNQITDYLRSKSYNLDFEDANYIKI